MMESRKSKDFEFRHCTFDTECQFADGLNVFTIARLVARLWTYETSILCEEELSSELPHQTAYLDYFVLLCHDNDFNLEVDAAGFSSVLDVSAT